MLSYCSSGRLFWFGGLFGAANASAHCTLCATCMSPINHHLTLYRTLVRLWGFLNSGFIWFCRVQSSTSRVSYSRVVRGSKFFNPTQPNPPNDSTTQPKLTTIIQSNSIQPTNKPSGTRKTKEDSLFWIFDWRPGAFAAASFGQSLS